MDLCGLEPGMGSINMMATKSRYTKTRSVIVPASVTTLRVACPIATKMTFGLVQMEEDYVGLTIIKKILPGIVIIRKTITAFATM
jgi:hypothetical protein